MRIVYIERLSEAENDVHFTRIVYLNWLNVERYRICVTDMKVKDQAITTFFDTGKVLPRALNLMIIKFICSHMEDLSEHPSFITN